MKHTSLKTLQKSLAGALVISSASAILLLSACGQRGPLYHPEPPPPISKSSTEATPTATPGNTQKSTKQ